MLFACYSLSSFAAPQYRYWNLDGTLRSFPLSPSLSDVLNETEALKRGVEAGVRSRRGGDLPWDRGTTLYSQYFSETKKDLDEAMGLAKLSLADSEINEITVEAERQKIVSRLSNAKEDLGELQRRLKGLAVLSDYITHFCDDVTSYHGQLIEAAGRDCSLDNATLITPKGQKAFAEWFKKVPDFAAQFQ